MHNRHDQPTLKWKFDNIYDLKLDLINWNEQHAIALVNMVHGDVGCNGWLVYVVVESMASSMIFGWMQCQCFFWINITNLKVDSVAFFKSTPHEIFSGFEGCTQDEPQNAQDTEAKKQTALLRALLPLLPQWDSGRFRSLNSESEPLVYSMGEHARIQETIIHTSLVDWPLMIARVPPFSSTGPHRLNFLYI